MTHLSLEVIVTGVLELSLPVRDVVLVDLALVAALRELDHFDLGHDWSVVPMEYLMLEYREEATAGCWAYAYADEGGESGRIFHLESQSLFLPARVHPPATRPRDICRLPRHQSGSGTNATRACGVYLRYDDITSQPMYFLLKLAFLLLIFYQLCVG